MIFGVLTVRFVSAVGYRGKHQHKESTYTAGLSFARQKSMTVRSILYGSFKRLKYLPGNWGSTCNFSGLSFFAWLGRLKFACDSIMSGL